ncbi:MAG: metallophosphoesterase family protein [Dehalococcoidia bacterium]
MKTFNSDISKILVISDTHQQTYDAIDIQLKNQIINADLVVHCGDITSEHVIKGIEENAKESIIVHGNSDPKNIRDSIPGQIVFKIQKFVFGVIHPYWGGPPPIDFDLILEQFGEVKPNFIFFGHTHDAHIEEYKGTTFVNPGQGYSEFIIPTSFCLFEIDNSVISINIKKILS